MPSWGWILVGLAVVDAVFILALCRAAGWGDDTIERWRR